MKNLRVLLLVLLAFLLPVRGAMGAAMLCPGAGAFGGEVATSQSGHGASHAADGMHAEPAAAHHHATGDDGTVDADLSPVGHPFGCQACASGCCVAPLAFTPPTVVPPPSTPTIVFPALSAPAAVFQSGGQDRPPRTI